MKKLNKKIIYGTGSVIFTAGVCVVIILLNIAASILTDKFGIRLDVTETRYLNFSDKFDDFIYSVDKDIDVYYLVNPSEITRVVNHNEANNVVSVIDNNNYRTIIKSMFEKIEKMNSKIHFEIVDPELNPDLVKKFGAVQIDDIAFSCGEMTNSFNVQEILYYDEYGRQTMDAETKFASMIGSVMRESKVKVGIVIGHGEGDTTEIKKVFDDEAIEYEDFNILTDGISDEYNLIFIYGPEVDFSFEEIKKIEEYLSSGNDMQIYFDNVSACPNLVDYMTTLGIQYGSEYVYENNSTRFTVLDGNKYCLIPQTSGHSVFENLTHYTLIPNTVSVTPMWASKNSIDCAPMMYTTNSGELYGNSAAKGSYCVVATSGRITESSVISNVIAGGSSEMYSTDVISTNKGFLLNSVLWMGRLDESSAYSLNIVSNVPLMITESQYNTWQLILVAVIPFIIIVIGLAVWLKRRYL